jgi:serine/threonine protein kinase
VITKEKGNTWQVGDIILDTYEVKQIHFGGGMGLVYRVYHRGWKMDLALKSPRPEMFRTDKQIYLFEKECETWINLGLHPHIVNCFYVRTLEGIPRIFAEYIQGGTLSEWICSRKLYGSDEKEALKHILDVAIQMAWGLHYAHEANLIHRDVKPANVLMTPGGMAKIADFGLAQARALTAEPELVTPAKSRAATTGLMTRAYCSPEQARGEPLTRRTDIWSWAVSVLEMLIGEVRWQDGFAAGEVLSDLALLTDRPSSVVNPPPEVADILQECLRWKQNDRPSNLGDIAVRLISVYEIAFGCTFPRLLPSNNELDADSLNNRMVSLVGLGKIYGNEESNAHSLMQQLLEKKPDHAYGRLNAALINWRYFGSTVETLMRHIDNALYESTVFTNNDWYIDIILNTCNTSKALMLTKASNEYDSEACSRVRILHNKIKHKVAELLLSDYEKRLCTNVQHDYTNHGYTDFRAHSCLNAKYNAKYDQFHRRISLTNTYSGITTYDLDTPHSVSKFALSENGNCIAIVNIDQNEDKYGLVLYRLSVCNSYDSPQWVTCSNSIFKKQITAITIDDNCQRITIWLESESGVYELVHTLTDGILQAFKCDFRQPSVIERFSDIFISGDGTLLLRAYGSIVSVWKYLSNNRGDRVNVIELDLYNYGLINTYQHLPGFELEYGYEYRIDALNAYNMMRLLVDILPHDNHRYLLCRPPDTGLLYEQYVSRERLLKEAYECERAGAITKAISRLNDCCILLDCYDDTILSYRHKLIKNVNSLYLLRAWHQKHHDWYWKSSVFGIQPVKDNAVRILWASGVEVSILPKMACEDREGWIDNDTIKQFSVGIKTCGNRQVLTLVHNRADPKHNILSLYTIATNGIPSSIWSFCLANGSWPERSQFRQVVTAGNVLYCVNSSYIVIAIDVCDGSVLGEVKVENEISWIKVVHLGNDAEYIFVAQSNAVCYLFNLDLTVSSFNNDIMSSLRRFHAIEAVSDDLSAALGWQGDQRLTHLSFKHNETTDIWGHHPRRVFGDASTSSFICKPIYIELSPCGRVISYIHDGAIFICDVARAEVKLKWIIPHASIHGLSFDGSGRWLVLAHSENKFEVFQLLWNIEEAPWNPAS